MKPKIGCPKRSTEYKNFTESDQEKKKKASNY